VSCLHPGDRYGYARVCDSSGGIIPQRAPTLGITVALTGAVMPVSHIVEPSNLASRRTEAMPRVLHFFNPIGKLLPCQNRITINSYTLLSSAGLRARRNVKIGRKFTKAYVPLRAEFQRNGIAGSVANPRTTSSHGIRALCVRF
jgi:hypothetical protein